ncbi:MAG: hypothetical protein HY854_07150 [Burkholderiales bacterium]|nr:hypothetical protein [Burkholderiales bacterium]
MLDLKKLLFAREARGAKARPAEADSDYTPSGRRGEGLEEEYRALVAAQFERWGIASDCTTIEVRTLGHAPDGLDVMVALVRLVSWERTSALRLLMGLPLLETKVRKSVRSSWLGEFSHFGGLWLHASDKLHATEAHHDLRDVLMQVAPPSGAHAQDGSSLPADYGQSSQPPLAPDTEIPASGSLRASKPGEEEPVA